jgi:hypothetical protein
MWRRAIYTGILSSALLLPVHTRESRLDRSPTCGVVVVTVRIELELVVEPSREKTELPWPALAGLNLLPFDRRGWEEEQEGENQSP